MTAPGRPPRPTVDPEFAALLPPATQEVVEWLEAKLRAEGCREKLVAWGETGILLDGHTRLALCERLGIEFEVESLSFPDRDAAKQWVVDHQLARRNLTAEQRAYYIGHAYLARRGTHGGDRTGQGATAAPCHGRAAEAVAGEHGVSARTVNAHAKFAEAVDAIGATNPDLKDLILTGRSGLTRAEVLDAAAVGQSTDASAGCPGCSRGGGASRPREKRPRDDRSDLAELKERATGLSRLFSVILNGEGEVSRKLDKYLTAAGLVDHVPTVIEGDEVKGGRKRFLPLAGVRALLELAELPGPDKSDAHVSRVYEEASGGFVPPLTKRRRRERGGRTQT